MTEYLHPCVPELKIKDYDLYRAFCRGVRSQLQAGYGRWARRHFDQDIVLLALLADGLAGREATLCAVRCGVLWHKKRRMVCHTQGIRLAAQVNVLLAWHACADLAAQAGLPLAARLWRRFDLYVLTGAYRRACAEAPQLERLLQQEKDHAQALMLSRCAAYDKASEPAANVFCALFACCAPDAGAVRHLRRAGLALGRIYFLLREAERCAADERRKSYNVFLENGLSGQAAAENAKYQCNLAAAELARSYNLLDMRFHRAITDNILYQGLEQSVARAGGIHSQRWEKI